MTENDKYYKKDKKGLYWYTGPQTLEDIEKRLLEIEQEKPRRIHNASENYSGSWEDEVETMDIAGLDVEKAVLQMKRQFILDKKRRMESKGLVECSRSDYSCSSYCLYSY